MARSPGSPHSLIESAKETTTMQPPANARTARIAPSATAGRSPPARAPRRRLHGRTALAVALLLGGMGSAWAWKSVHDAINHNVLQQIREETRATKENAGKTEDAVKEAAREAAPQWTAGGNRGAYDPYAERKDEKTYGYADMEGVERAQTLNMQARCGASQNFSDKALWQVPEVGGTSGGTGGTGGAASGDGGGGGGLDAVQRQSCMRLVAAENLRFNEILKMHARIKQRNKALKALAERRGEIDEAGQLAVSDNNLQMFVADSQVEIQYIHATIAAYDSLIASLKQSQDLNARQALVGEPGEAATSARLASLEAALGIL